VRIDWHLKRPTNKKAKRRAVQSQAGEGLGRRREEIECTQLQLSGSARTAGSVVVFARFTPVAGPIFENKNRAIFLERFFGRGISGESLLPLQLCSHELSVEWIHFPRIRTLVEKRFHGLFSKKMRSKSGVFLRFQEENTF